MVVSIVYTVEDILSLDQAKADITEGDEVAIPNDILEWIKARAKPKGNASDQGISSKVRKETDEREGA